MFYRKGGKSINNIVAVKVYVIRRRLDIADSGFSGKYVLKYPHSQNVSVSFKSYFKKRRPEGGQENKSRQKHPQSIEEMCPGKCFKSKVCTVALQCLMPGPLPSLKSCDRFAKKFRKGQLLYP